MDKITIAGEGVSESVDRSDDSCIYCRSGEDCIIQDNCPGFLDLKEQLKTAAKGTVQFSRLLTRWVLMVETVENTF